MRRIAALFSLAMVLLATVFISQVRAQPRSVAFSAAAEEVFVRGLQDYSDGQYEEARDVFSSLLEHAPNQRSSAGQLMLSKCYFRLRQFESALDAARGLQRKYAASRYVPEARLLTGDSYYELKRYYEAATQYGRLLATPAPLVTQAQAAERLAAIVKNGYISTKALESIRLSVGNKRLREALFFGRTRWYNRLGWQQEAAVAARAYQDSIGTGIFSAFVQADVDLDYVDFTPDPIPISTEKQPAITALPADSRPKIGLLLPMTGPYRSIAEELYVGVQMANEEAGDLFQLIVADTGVDYGELPISINPGNELSESPGSGLLRVVHGANSLIDQGVTAIIGPIFSSSCIAAAVVAEAAGVPLIAPLSQQSGLDLLGRYIFQLNAIPETQGRMLGEYATLVLGLQNLVVISPLSDYGWNFEREFKRVISANGGRVVHSDWYVTEQTKDFRLVFEEIRRIGFELMPAPEDTLAAADSLEWAGEETSQPSFLTELLQGLEEDEAEEEPAKEEAPPDSTEIFIDTIDGIIVVVESFQDAMTIAPQVRFYRLQTQVLGNDIWYDPERLRQMRAGERKYMDGTILVSARREEPPQPRSFVDAYRSRFARDPRYAAYGFDAGQLVAEAWRQGRGNREQMRDWLAAVRDYVGASGNISFGDERRTNVDLTLLKIDKDRIRALNVEDLPDLGGVSDDLPIPELDLPTGQILLDE